MSKRVIATRNLEVYQPEAPWSATAEGVLTPEAGGFSAGVFQPFASAGLLREERRILVLYCLTDALLFALALSLATLARWPTLYQVDFVALQRDRLVCLVLFVAVGLIAGLYRPAVIRDPFDSVYYALLAVGGAVVAQFALASLLPVGLRVISRRELLASAVLAAVLLGCWHYWGAGLLNRFASLRRFFYVVGDEEDGKRIAREIELNLGGLARARYMPFSSLRDVIEQRIRRLGHGLGLREDVVIVPTGKERAHLAKTLEFCGQHFCRTFLYPTLHDTLMLQHSNLLAIAGIPLIQVGVRQPLSPYLRLKRMLDVTVALAALLVALPLGLVTAAAVRLTSRGGVFYLQERLGRGGRPFQIIKFRSMVAGDGNGDDYVRADKNDPRITAVGRFLRKYRLDELPQFINVLKGDMSLIGPRPLWRDFFLQHGEESPLWERRLAVRPGLTSLSHVQGSSFSDPGDFLRYDLIYISSVSFMLDLKILVGTLRAVLSGKGA